MTAIREHPPPATAAAPAMLFTVGLLAAGIVTAGERTRSRPWARYALAGR
jgi:hypothetical protein